MPESRDTERLVTLIIGAALAFNYPLLYLFADGGTVLGIPLLFLYLFLTWLMVIVLTALLMERRSPPVAGGAAPEDVSARDD